MSSSPRLAIHPVPATALHGKQRLLDCLDEHLGVRLPGAFSPDECARLVHAVYEARPRWNADFGGEQFSLGRAFYTHLETDRTRQYFASAAASDALVERYLPGLQERVRGLYRTLLGGEVRHRRGFCGPGVHIFPAGEHVARHGGVVHFDTEGLSEHHLEQGIRALTLVIMLQPAEQGGGLRLWDVFYEGRDEALPEELEAPSAIADYQIGEALLLDSYRLHQIQAFGGNRDRISITAHAAEVDDNVWEVWF